jgi:hypothetical protein
MFSQLSQLVRLYGMSVAALSYVPRPSPTPHSAFHVDVEGEGDKENGDFENIDQNKG